MAGPSDAASIGGRSMWPQALAVLVSACLLLGVGLSATGLWAPDEPRYGQIADELRSMRHGLSGLLLLHLNDEVYTQKPPLYFWLAAGLGAPGGRVSENLLRLPSALAGIASVLATFALGRRLFAHPGIALWGAVVLLTTFRFAHQARRGQLDVLLGLFELLAMLVFVRIEQGRGSLRHGVFALHALLGLAVLTKGPVGLLPLAVIAVVLGIDGRLGELRKLCPPGAFLLSLGPGLLWIAVASVLAPTGYFGDAVVDNVLMRFLSGTDHIRPLYYFFYQLPLDFLPWSLVWLPLAWLARSSAGAEHDGAIARDRPARPRRFLAVWIAVHFAFFSLSAGKRGLYLLPVLPAVALLCATTIQAALARHPSLGAGGRKVLVAAALVVAGAGLVIAAAGGFLTSSGSFALPGAFGLALAAIGGCGALAARRVAQTRTSLFGFAASVLAIELAIFLVLYPAFDGDKSPQPIAQAAATAAGADGAIGVFDHTALTGGIAYYSGRHVVDLQDEADVRDFLASGQHTIVVRARRYEDLLTWEPLRVYASQRAGRREILVVTPFERVPHPEPPASSAARPGTESRSKETVHESGGYPTGL